jgi:hypothetical protein
MPRPSTAARPRAAPPFLLSLAAHGLLLLGLGLWPRNRGDESRPITDTRIELCTLADEPSSLPPAAGSENSAATGADVDVEPLRPTLVEGAPLPPGTPVVGSGPTLVGGPPGVSGHGGGTRAGGGLGLFPGAATARSVVYVIDRSMSMGLHDTLAVAQAELLTSLRHLPATTLFQVIAYNGEARPLSLDGRSELLTADSTTVERVARMIEALDARGNTNHADALLRGLQFGPDVLYFVTDADDLSLDDVRKVTRLNEGRNQGHTVIHAIELTRRGVPAAGGALARLATWNGGTYRRVAVSD